MNSVLSNQTFFLRNRGRHLSETYRVPQNLATAFMTTHFELAASDLAHYHDEPHLTFILNGGVLDKRKNFERELTGGGLMFFYAGEAHQTISRTFPTKYFSLQFEKDFFKRNTFSENELKISTEQNPQIKLSLLKIYKELLTNDEFSATSAEMLLLSLIDSQNSRAKFRPPWLGKVVEILHDRWNEPLSVEELATTVGVHQKTVSKYFPRYFACTLGEYRRRLKIERALALIKSSGTSLTDIAYHCGFYDQSHFTGTFKMQTGFRPKQFQKL